MDNKVGNDIVIEDIYIFEGNEYKKSEGNIEVNSVVMTENSRVVRVKSLAHLDALKKTGKRGKLILLTRKTS